MFRTDTTPYWFLIALFYFGFLLPGLAQQSGAADTPAAASQPDSEIPDLQQLTDEIKERREDLGKRIASLAATYREIAKPDQVQALASVLTQLDAVYEQQVTEVERQRALQVKLQQLSAEIGDMRKRPQPGQRHSFMEWDQIRDELTIESSREPVLASKVEDAEQALEQASSEVRQLQEKAADTQGGSRSEVDLATARAQLELAQQTETLRRFELRGERMAKSVHQRHLALLQGRVDYLRHHATFGAKELQQQLRRIDKEVFELNRVVSHAKGQQNVVKSRLEQMRKKFVTAAPSARQAIEAESDALQLEYEALKNEIDSKSQRVEWLQESKQLWNRRHAVFNATVEQAKLPEWKSEAKRHLDTLDREEDSLRLWLGDWQKRLASLQGKLESGQHSKADGAVVRQRDKTLQIIGSLQELRTALDDNRQLQQKLIDDIELRTASRSWRESIEATMFFRIHGNSLLDWSYALGSALVTFLVLYFMRWILIRRLKHLETPGKPSLAGGFLNTIKRANSVFFLMIGVFVASHFLSLDPASKNTIYSLTKVAIVFQAAVWGSGLTRTWIFLILARRTKRDGASMGALTIFNFASQVILWSIALLLILQNLGVDVTALVAGLGIGGIAVALSLQRILNDLFSSLSIVLDKPFVVGDFVVFDDFFGCIEHIGIKTTRIRSLSGEQIICANGDLLNTRIRNFKRMAERRVVFKIGVVYQTPREKLRMVPLMIREIIEARENTRFDRAHFASYGDFALLFEVVYYVLSPDYNLYMDIQQAINLEIFDRFQANGIEFAYPSQSIYLQQVSDAFAAS